MIVQRQLSSLTLLISSLQSNSLVFWLSMAVLILLRSPLTAEAASITSEFPLGDAESKFSWGQSFPELNSASDQKLKLGFRLQSALLNKNVDSNGTAPESNQDFSLRRVRFQFDSHFADSFKFYMDVRNDRSNYLDQGEGQFEVGDAFVEWQQLKYWSCCSVKLFRAKVDMSRSETVSSADLIYHDRPLVADYAASFVSQARRATNAQVNGTLLPGLQFHIVVGDGIESDSLIDASGTAAQNITEQGLMVGGKLMLFPGAHWQETSTTETYFGRGQHIKLGLGHFHLDRIEFEYESDNTLNSAELSRDLTNLEISAHYLRWAIQAEWFRLAGLVPTWRADLETTNSWGGYAHIEYYIGGSYALAPYVRYEIWDQSELADAQVTNYVLGLSQYWLGNKIKSGVFYQHFDYAADLNSGDPKTVDLVQITSQWHY